MHYFSCFEAVITCTHNMCFGQNYENILNLSIICTYTVKVAVYSLRERLRTKKFTQKMSDLFYLYYHKLSTKSYVVDVY